MPTFAERSEKYQFYGEIARGGMGAVLKGRDVDLGRDLAVKVLLEQHRDNPDLVRRFVEEAQIGGQLQHPGVVPVYELGTLRRPPAVLRHEAGQGPHPGRPRWRTARTPAEDRPRFLGVFEQVCQTMAYAHVRGVIHRDLKPSNVMVGSFGEVQVMDWGLAKVLPRGGVADDERGRAGPSRDGDPDGAGPARMPTSRRPARCWARPPTCRRSRRGGEIDRLDERADVFGLGAILCEILTGQPAFTADRRADDPAQGRDGRAG